MNIALDFDDTYTADPTLWNLLIDGCHALGHRLYVVTCRHDTPENREDVRVEYIKPHRHFFTGHAAKKWFMEQRGIKIDVWIENDPATILRGM